MVCQLASAVLPNGPHSGSFTFAICWFDGKCRQMRTSDQTRDREFAGMMTQTSGTSLDHQDRLNVTVGVKLGNHRFVERMVSEAGSGKAGFLQAA